jgi:hypothetical protein
MSHFPFGPTSKLSLPSFIPSSHHIKLSPPSFVPSSCHSLPQQSHTSRLILLVTPCIGLVSLHSNLNQHLNSLISSTRSAPQLVHILNSISTSTRSYPQLDQHLNSLVSSTRSAPQLAHILNSISTSTRSYPQLDQHINSSSHHCRTSFISFAPSQYRLILPSVITSLLETPSPSSSVLNVASLRRSSLSLS